MSIRKLEIENFKSFKNLPVELGRFNVLIGANASGKSNFTEIFKFLRDITKSGLDKAIYRQGGVQYLRNINIGSSDYLSLRIISDQRFGFIRETKEWIIGINIEEVIYEFSIAFKKKGTGFEIVKDKLTEKCKFIKYEKKNEKLQEKENLGPGEIILASSKGKLSIELKDLPPTVPIREDDIIAPFLLQQKLSYNTLLLEAPFFFFLPPLVLGKIFSDFSIYDFDPKLAKKAIPAYAEPELKEDVSNLSIVIKDIIKHKENKRKFLNLISELLPFVDDLKVKKFEYEYLLFLLREKYFEKQYLPASLISDGTINMTALIIALYFEKKPLTIIEEPERNIHPYLISRMVNMMKDGAREKQIIVTTHNPEIVKHAGLENILLISRDKEGFSTICRPTDKEEVKIFLKNDIGIEELYVQSLLEV